jgi:peroxiredoxin
MEHVDQQTAALPILKPDGTSVPLGSLWAERPVLLTLVRHFGCQFCREQVAQMRHIRGDIESLDTAMVFVGNGTPPMAEAFIEETGLDVPLYTNPGREVYQALGTRRPSALAVLDPRLWLNGLRSVLRGHFPGRTRGDRAQLGGVFLILAGGSMPFAFRSRRGGDYPPNADILAAVRASRPAETRSS